MFFTFYQNNSGGSFDHDEVKGIGYRVIIEAKSENEANKRAEEIGIYFNGVNQGRDCKCCGDRWSNSFLKGTDIPMIYNEDVSSGIYLGNWCKIFSYIHYLNGEIKKVGINEKC